MNAYKNKFDWSGECATRGLNAEELFVVKATQYGFDVKKTCKDDDMFRKIDYFIRKSPVFRKNDPDCGEIYTVDVKAMKKISRNDAEPQDQWTWIELHGVNAGNKGWLYGGESDFIAFQTVQGFILVPRQMLIELVKDVVDFDKRVRTSQEAAYRVYQRAGRLDEITLIEKKFLLDIVWEEWK